MFFEQDKTQKQEIIGENMTQYDLEFRLSNLIKNKRVSHVTWSSYQELAENQLIFPHFSTGSERETSQIQILIEHILLTELPDVRFDLLQCTLLEKETKRSVAVILRSFDTDKVTQEPVLAAEKLPKQEALKYVAKLFHDQQISSMGVMASNNKHINNTGLVSLIGWEDPIDTVIDNIFASKMLDVPGNATFYIALVPIKTILRPVTSEIRYGDGRAAIIALNID